MPSLDHPLAITIASFACLVAAFPLARFFFDDFESFKEEAGLSRDWEQQLWLLGCVPSNPMLYVKGIGFFGILAIGFVAIYFLCLRIAGTA